VPTGTCKSRAIIELQRYIEEPLLPHHSDPLNWWKTHAYNYPNLSRIVREKFGTVATSVSEFFQKRVNYSQLDVIAWGLKK
jgi:hypothetical protein